MLSKKILNRILIISLSNVGDVFLTSPVVHQVKKTYPSSEITLLVGKGAKEVFLGDSKLKELILYDKRASLFEKYRFVRELRRRNFDLVVDLRNSLFPLFLGVPFHTPLFAKPPRKFVHKIDQHLWKLKSIGISIGDWQEDSLEISQGARENIAQKLNFFGLKLEDPFILLSPGSKSELKRWTASSYATLSDRLYREMRLPILFIGEKNDASFVETIASSKKEKLFSLVGQTSIPELVALIHASKLLVSNDNATIHIASLLGISTVAIFGPTDPQKYGPRAKQNRVVRKNLFCSPCEKAKCPYHHECMEQLSTEDVYTACLELLSP